MVSSLFKASTWEEFRALANGNAAIEEVGSLIFELNTDNQAKELLEGQRRYKEMMASQYTAGYTDAEEKFAPVIDELTDKYKTLSDENKTLSDELDRINKLLAEKGIKL